jgi:signal transduction histidine kinase/AmiR/NasT family two-component response regulator
MLPETIDGLADRRNSGVSAGIIAVQRAKALLKKGAIEEAMLKGASFSSIATDEAGIIQVFSVGAERMLGYAAADVTNRLTAADFSDPREIAARATALSIEFARPIAPGFEALAYRAARGIEDSFELTQIRKDGTRIAVAVSLTALRDDEGAIIGYLMIGTDNTSRKQVEAEQDQLARALHLSNSELKRAKLAAEKANLAKSDFLSSMSHELRSPLNAILGFAQLIDSGTPPPTSSQKESVDQILQAGWYLLDLINEILDLALIESGRLSLSPEPMSLAEVLGDCQAMIEPQAQKSGIRLFFPKIATAYHVKADRTRVKQIIINLLSNAIKYNRPGGSVEIRCEPGDAQRLRISFHDTGEGLSAAELAQLFEPFNRLGRESGPEEGTGIGLVVSKRLVELMGGAIGAQSTVGVGSVFWIELNAIASQCVAADSIEPAEFTGAEGHVGASLHTLLCVEDNPANLLLVEKLLERRPDVRLLTARDGHRGIQLARTVLPDVVLMDINLPGISGLTALGILAADPVTSRIPVIALSANAMPHDIERGLRAGFYRYLTKPIKVREFMDTLDAALKSAADDRLAASPAATTS